eukprot:TRINITY_DN4311_c0_g3_i3.p1 TRINITY_DN4311_c0_g3~~TRINITY_DN4311_c0_g3_i3.p1  ORF type:complete len:1016 (-),score=89.58 TRINITY_DN4311_c0_g3_i3:312-3314(-)
MTITCHQATKSQRAVLGKYIQQRTTFPSRKQRCYVICQEVATKPSQPAKSGELTLQQYMSSGELIEPLANGSALQISKHPKYTLFVGSPTPFGATWNKSMNGYNFAIFSSSAQQVSICLFTEADLKQGTVTEEVVLTEEYNKTGSVWHICIVGLDPNILYGYRFSGLNQDVDTDAAGHRYKKDEIVLDPYAIAVLSRRQFTELGQQLSGKPLNTTWTQAACALPQQSGGRSVAKFDWRGDKPLGLPMEDLVIYETHVRGFTKDPLSRVQAPGTYAGMIERLDYVKDLGINCIELLPVFDFNELEYYQETGKIERYNYWGYSTINFFAPMSRFSQGIADGNNSLSAVTELKTLVREAHRRGIEVILDVVFNHTAEGNEYGPTINFRGIDNRVYYMLASGGEYYNYSGCGNTFNCNHPQVRTFILDCLKYWVQEYHIDGFRFDLAPILTRQNSLFHETHYVSGGKGDATGTPLSNPPLIEMISNDPLLKNTKLVAEAWDADGLTQLGAFPHYGGRWGEWNGNFRDTVRQFIKGTDGPWASKFAAAICGSPDLFHESNPHEGDWWGQNGGRQWKGGRHPYHSVNFITAHDGFTLMDLVSYNEKHNLGNGEDNRDGESHNLSWNCGVEGATNDAKVLGLRARQMRNFAMALFLSQGVPMLIMGDEYGHSKGGNNNTYCHDSMLNWFSWDKAERDPTGFRRFVKKLIHFRRKRGQLHQKYYIQSPGITFHGAEDPGKPDWSDNSRFTAFTLQGNERESTLYVAFNSAHTPQAVQLPQIGGSYWKIIVDTGKPAPYDFLQEDSSLSAQELVQVHNNLAMWTQNNQYPMLPWSAIMLECVHQPLVLSDEWEQRQKSWTTPKLSDSQNTVQGATSTISQMQSSVPDLKEMEPAQPASESMVPAPTSALKGMQKQSQSLLNDLNEEISQSGTSTQKVDIEEESISEIPKAPPKTDVPQSKQQLPDTTTTQKLDTNEQQQEESDAVAAALEENKKLRERLGLKPRDDVQL